MPDVIHQAQPPLEFIPPAFNPLFLRGVQLMLPSWIRYRTEIRQIEADNVEVLVDLYRQFQERKIRFLLAFRHPKVQDPFCLGYLLSHILPRVARRKGIKLQHPIHAHFIYDRGIPLWAGSHVGWIASQLGGTPIQRGKADWTGLRSARELFVNGNFPMAAAPEGATNGHSEIVNPLEPGIAQLSFWCAEDLHKGGRDEQVLIVPVGIQYSYLEAPWGAIANLLGELETVSGLPVEKLPTTSLHGAPTPESLYPRLLGLSEHLLSLIEKFYTQFYHQKLPVGDQSDRNEAIAARLQVLLNVVLLVAEQYFDLQPKGNLNDRCRRVEQAGFNYIFREEYKNVKALSPVERALGDRVAEEANLRMWHMRLVESFVAVTGKYVREKPTAERFAETTLLIWDMVTRIRGTNPFRRPQLGKQQVKMTIGEPLSVSERYPVYKASRQGARQAVADLTKDLQQAMEGLIVKGE
ncbi:1-acyl-sn-glycerol-3-phosphate acyltransferase [Iningainema tapete]|uniref:1-acyl-sn-glycerol-3-phosphate acyltransferase n=1 Tax=Iningainema tapete BLCC-T55 TaxID=2748662 RepID=A0A8J6XBU5_9CYAN|nr:1-acyl-sn-glycerol-3-phosphate acyltransferase [Iningainema tapete]MBD2771939.1 1-acyl-sn-glycerol-3-phosphate acyltransferase [Iningainema tapete BLCC-T55]